MQRYTGTLHILASMTPTMTMKGNEMIIVSIKLQVKLAPNPTFKEGTNMTTPTKNKTNLTNRKFPFYLLEDEARLVGEFRRLCPQAANLPVFPEFIIVQTQLEELLQDVVDRIVAFQTAHVIEQHLQRQEKIEDSHGP